MPLADACAGESKGARLTRAPGGGILCKTFFGDGFMIRKTIIFMGLMACAVLWTTGCFRATESTIELHIPAMQTQECAKLVRNGLARLGNSIYDVKIDVEARRAWVKYDNVRLGRRNIEVAVSHAGFAVNDWPADQTAYNSLLPECRGE